MIDPSQAMSQATIVFEVGVGTFVTVILGIYIGSLIQRYNRMKTPFFHKLWWWVWYVVLLTEYIQSLPSAFSLSYFIIPNAIAQKIYEHEAKWPI